MPICSHVHYCSEVHFHVCCTESLLTRSDRLVGLIAISGEDASGAILGDILDVTHHVSLFLGSKNTGSLVWARRTNLLRASQEVCTVPTRTGRAVENRHFQARVNLPLSTFLESGVLAFGIYLSLDRCINRTVGRLPSGDVQ